MKKLKAEAFLISSIIIAMIFILLFFRIGIFRLLANKAAMESFAIVTNEISNINNEIEKIPGISFNVSDEELIENIKNFTQFVRENYEIRERRVAIVALLAFTSTPVEPNENMTLNVSILNQRTESIHGLKLNFSYDGSVRNSTIIDDGVIWNTSFTFNTTVVEPPYTFDLFFKSELFPKVDTKILLPIEIGEKFKTIWSEVLVAG